MKKFLSNTTTILASTIILFILVNIIIILTWPIYLDLKFKDYKPYSAEINEQLQMNEKDSLQLYLETWIDRSFSYSQFVEHEESPTEGKYVNITKEFGRKIDNPTDCLRKIFVYGGSTTFGYNVADYQTIPAYLLKTLEKNNFNNYCVYNFGGGSYFSTQENIRFIKHILTERYNKGDFALFIDGHNESGFRKTRTTDYLKESFKPANENFWNMYKYTFVIFIKSLPIIQFSNRLLKKFNIDLDKNVSQAGSIKLIPDDLLLVYEKNIKIRSSICETEKINCFSFLQPFATVHGNYFVTKDGIKIKNGGKLGEAPEICRLNELDKELSEKYNILKNAEGTINISSSLDNIDGLTWCDGSHYCPNGNEAIAKRIFIEIKSKLD